MPRMAGTEDATLPELVTQPEPVRAATGRPGVRQPFAAGMSVAHYELMRPLGKGGMGEVWLARDTRLGRRVALKFLLTVNAKHAARFFVEAKATAQLSHENIVALHDIGEHAGCPYMVLEYVPGKTLSSWMLERKTDQQIREVPAARIAALMLPVARALQCAHAAGIVHRDLKPANIMLADSGTVKVLDFGVAKILDDAADTQLDAAGSPDDWALKNTDAGGLTETGAMVGTRSYMAPEQWWGEPVDARTDLWALGIMMYQLAVGVHPAGSPLTPEALIEIAKREIPMPGVRERLPDIGRLGTLIDRCLMKFRDDRVESADELCKQLEEISREQNELRSGNPRDEERNPYAGLSAFQEHDARWFFGRETLVEHILLRLTDSPLLALVGSSGAGKSSLARAGVIPALVQGGEAWEAFVVRPGPHPLSILADLLLQHSWQRSSLSMDAPSSRREHLSGPSNQRDTMVEQLRNEPGFFGVQLRARAVRRREHVFLFVDQFEEIFTLASDIDRQLFFQCLTGAADDSTSPVRVMISIRHDFLDRVASTSGPLAELISRGTVLVGPLDRSGLRRALTAPAEVLGFRMESETMVLEMLDTLVRTTSALPLLQFTAAHLWDGRDRARRLLTEATYRQIGGVEGALASHADSILATMTGAEKKWAKTLLLRLVTSEATRAIVTRKELAEIGGQAAPDVERVLARLVDARLIVVEGTETESTVELIHESLITKWPLFQQWLEEGKDDARFLMRLRTAAKEWEQEGRPEGLLWRGSSADEARTHWRSLDGSPGTTNLIARETQFLEAIIALGERERRRKRIITALFAGSLAAFVLVISALAIRAGREAERANFEAIRANEEAIRTKNANLDAELNALRARNATRMAVAREHQDDPTIVLAMLREVEKESVPRGWNDLVVSARNASTARAVLLHGDAVRDVQYHPNGKQIVSACLDGTVRVWNADGFGEPLILRGHESAAWSAAFSPDGKKIVSASHDNTVRVWNSDGSGQTIVLRGHDAVVSEAAFSPDGKRIASVSADGSIRVWNSDGSGEPTVLRGHKDAVHSVVFLGNGERLVSGSFDDTVRVWNSDGSGEPSVKRGHDGVVWAVAAHPDGKHFASASADNTIRLWHVDEDKPIRVFQGHDGQVFGIAFSPDGKRIASASQDKTVRIWNTDGSGTPTVIRGHTGNTNRVAFSPDGKYVVSASYDQSVRKWDVEDASRRLVAYSPNGAAIHARFSPDGQFIASAQVDGTVLLRNSNDLELRRTFRGHTSVVVALAWSPDGRRIASGSLDATIRIWNVNGQDEPVVLRGHEAGIGSVRWSHDGRRIVSASTDKTIRIWDPEQRKELVVLRGHESEVTAVSFSKDDQQVVSSSLDRTVRVWNADGSGQTLTLKHDALVNAVSWNLDNSRLVSAAFDRIVRIWDPRGQSPPLALQPHDDTPSIAGENAFSPDGKRFLTSSNDGVFRIWNMDGQGEPLTFRVSTLSVYSAVFSPDGRQVLTTSGDKLITIWRNLEPMDGPDDARLWTATSHCPPIELRRKWLGFSEAQLEVDMKRCLQKVEQAYMRH